VKVEGCDCARRWSVGYSEVQVGCQPAGLRRGGWTDKEGTLSLFQVVGWLGDVVGMREGYALSAGGQGRSRSPYVSVWARPRAGWDAGRVALSAGRPCALKGDRELLCLRVSRSHREPL
jgi:hypothetical protein